MRPGIRRQSLQSLRQAPFELDLAVPGSSMSPNHQSGYTLEFLGLPQAHTEAELHRGLLNSLREFLIEMGRDFCFIGSEVPLQVGNQDFALDLLFFHRGLNCLVAVELKVGRFEPEYLGYGKPDVMKRAA